jgi:AraC-like DNA-binding protein
MSRELVQSPVNPDWLIPRGWGQILGLHMDYRLGESVLHLWRVQFNQHAGSAPAGPSHAHSRHQLLYYQRGSGSLEVDDKTYDIAAGSIFFVPAGRQHRFTGQSAEAPICLAMDFSIDEARTPPPEETPGESEAAILLSLLYAQPARPFPLRTVDQQPIDQCIEEIVRENDAREVGYTALTQALLLRLIALCLRGTQRAHGFGEHFRHTTWRHRMIADRAAALLRMHATRQPDLTLEEAARHCATSANHLNRILREQTGATFRQALIRQRLGVAHELLVRGKHNCTEVALEAGFEDPNYFARVFRRVYGHPPSDLLWAGEK